MDSSKEQIVQITVFGLEEKLMNIMRSTVNKAADVITKTSDAFHRWIHHYRLVPEITYSSYGVLDDTTFLSDLHNMDVIVFCLDVDTIDHALLDSKSGQVMDIASEIRRQFPKARVISVATSLTDLAEENTDVSVKRKAPKLALASAARHFTTTFQTVADYQSRRKCVMKELSAERYLECATETDLQDVVAAACHLVMYSKDSMDMFNGECTKLGVFLGQDINEKINDKNQTSLHKMCMEGNAEAVVILCSHLRTDVNVEDVDGRTALHYACEGDLKLEIVKALLKTETLEDVNSPDKTGRVPIMSYFGEETCVTTIEIISMFLDHPSFSFIVKTKKMGSVSLYEMIIDIGEKAQAMIYVLGIETFIFSRTTVWDYDDLEDLEEFDGGAFAIAYKAKLKVSSCYTCNPVYVPVVCKVAKKRDADSDTWHESRLLQTVPRHRNIIGLVAICLGFKKTDSEHLSAILLNYKSGGSLYQYLKAAKQPVSFKTLCVYAQDLVRGIAHLHNNSWIHLDVSARNLLVGKYNGRNILNITDFGLSIRQSEKSRAKLIPTQWAAPEFMSGNKVSVRSDVWSIGITFMEMAVYPYIPPYFPGQPDELNEMLMMIKAGRRWVPGPPLNRRILPNEWILMCQSCWRMSPDERANLDDLLYTLKQLESEKSEIVPEEESDAYVLDQFDDSSYAPLLPASAKQRKQSDNSAEDYDVKPSEGKEHHNNQDVPPASEPNIIEGGGEDEVGYPSTTGTKLRSDAQTNIRGKRNGKKNWPRILAARLLMGMEASIPRLVIMIPGPELKKGTSVWNKLKPSYSTTLTTKWKIVVLCEGNGKICADREIHFQGSTDISLPREWIQKAIVSMRVGVAGASCVLDGGSGVELGFVSKLLDSLEVDGLNGLKLYLAEMEEMLTGSTAQKLPKKHRSIVEHYKELRSFLKERLTDENVRLGKMGTTQLYFDPNNSTFRWVCDKHNGGLLPKTSAPLAHLEKLTPNETEAHNDAGKNTGSDPDSTADAGYRSPNLSPARSGTPDDCKRFIRRPSEYSASTLTSGYGDLFHACKIGDSDLVKLYLPLFSGDAKVWPVALRIAAQNDSVDVVEVLITSNADPNGWNEEWQTPLHLAAAKGHVGVVDFLCQLEATDIELADLRGRTPVHYALCRLCSKTCDEQEKMRVVEVIKVLSTRSSTVINVRDHKGRTAFHWACIKREKSVIKELLELPSLDVNIPDNRGHSAIYFLLSVPEDKMKGITNDDVKIIQMITCHSSFDLSASTEEIPETIYEMALYKAGCLAGGLIGLFGVENFHYPKPMFLQYKQLYGVKPFASGYNGRVYEARIDIAREQKYPRTIEGDDAKENISHIWIPVVCKVSEKRPRADEWYEIQVFQNLPPHKNVLGLVAMCTGFKLDKKVTANFTAMVLNFKNGGSLLRELKGKQEGTTYSLNELCSYGLDIVRGVSHMHNNNYKHCDIAARNCMINRSETKGSVLSITDFGLARPHEDDHDLEETQFPIKWCAPETLDSGKTSFRSDVWMIGITFFEMAAHSYTEPYSFCFSPRPNENYAKTLVELLRYGKAECLPKVYRDRVPKKWLDLCDSCCQLSGDERINLDDLVSKLHELIPTGARVDVVGGEASVVAGDTVAGGDGEKDRAYYYQTINTETHGNANVRNPLQLLEELQKVKKELEHVRGKCPDNEK